MTYYNNIIGGIIIFILYGIIATTYHILKNINTLSSCELVSNLKCVEDIIWQ